MTMAPAPAAPGALLRTDSGHILPMQGERWLGRAQLADLQLLAQAEAPVLDIGCGPGRHVQALAERGTHVLGIDLSPAAVALCRRKGLAVLEGSIFGFVPDAGKWGAALLLDGNIGIGGDPIGLLDRVKSLLRPGGRVIAEVSDEVPSCATMRVRLELDGDAGPWFDWAALDVHGLRRAADAVGLQLVEFLELDGRLFGILAAPH